MNKIEELKAQKDGLDVGDDIPRYARLGVEAIEEGDVDRLKWWGVFLRKQTPGHFMIRLRIPNGVANAAQLRTIAAIANRVGRGIETVLSRWAGPLISATRVLGTPKASARNAVSSSLAAPS